MTLDDLEFELRKLPGVRAAGFDDRGDVLMVQLHLAPNGGRGDDAASPLPVAASRIAARHCDKPVAVEVVRWRQAPAPAVEGPSDAAGTATVTAIGAAGAGATGGGATAVGTEGSAEPAPRPRLLAVLSFPDTDEVEVHLVLHGRRAIGRAAASGGLLAVVSATLDALRGFGIDLTAEPSWAREMDDGGSEHHLVAVAVEEPEPGHTRFGLAGGSSAIDAGARATLDALNRQIERGLGNERS